MTDLRAPLTKGCRYIFLKDVGSGCGSVGRAVASDLEVCGSNPVIGKIYIEHFTVNCIEKTKIKKKETGNGPFFNNELSKRSKILKAEKTKK